ncbi:calcium-binding protein [Amaricoccus macauensis]|uniref:calcium-binding protein n=1 Tax=Amaricoccus macauensis TaxID=57001 RepID=UPI003C7B3117
MAKLEKILPKAATEGDDYIVGTEWAEVIEGLGGDDKIKAKGGDDTVRGGDGEDTIKGGGGDDVMLGDRGNDKIYGEYGNDTNIWNNGDGTDKFYGGKGWDTQIVNGSADLGDEFLIQAYGEKVQLDRVNFGQFGVTMKDVEELKVNGLGGDDTIEAGEGLADLIKLKLSGGEGHDFIRGGDGEDKIYGDEGDDLTVGFRGNDKIYGGYGDDTNVWNNGDGTDVFKGGKGYDTQIVNGADAAGDAFTIEAYGEKVEFARENLGPFGITLKQVEELQVNGQGGDDTIEAGEGLADIIKLKLSGGEGNDEIIGGDGNDKLYGDEGDDELEGEVGDDSMFGGAGDDTMEWDNGDGSDLMEGGEGYDTAEVEGALEAGDHFVIEANGDRVAFERVNLGNFTLDIGTTEKLEVDGAGGDDTIEAGKGLDKLIELKLSGGKGNDWIEGGDGDDWIDGGKGYDVMTGGEGADTFVFKKGEDVITDFEKGVDKIVMEKYDAYWEFEAKIEQHGDDVTIEYGKNSLTIENVETWELNESDFMFV